VRRAANQIQEFSLTITPTADGNFATQTLNLFPPTFMTRLGGKSTYDVVWADTVVSYGSLVNLNESANHVVGTILTGGILSPGNGGWNNAYKDGHVEWVRQSYVLRKWFWSDGVALYRGFF